MLKLSQTLFNTLKSNNRPCSAIKFASFKSTIAAEAKSQSTIYETDNEESQVVKPKRSPIKSHNTMVAAAFAALKPETGPQIEIRTPSTDDKINKATNIDELLSISGGSGVSRRYALKVVSTLADWSSSGKAKLAEFENDPRFIKLCRVLTKGTKISRNLATNNEDLSTVLNVAADDEAARLVANLTLPQSVKVVTTLSQKKRRSLFLLRTLAYNITASSQRLNLKESADLLYSMCILNYHDDNLVDKICQDIKNELGSVLKTSSVIGSILTSLGVLRYKNCETLDALSDWVLDNHKQCRPQDIFSLFITLATLNYSPANGEELFKVLIPQLSEAEAKKPLIWLNVVWALVLLNQATPIHVSNVLSQDFVNKIEGNKELNTFGKVKLLNINGAALHLMKDYNGPVLANSSSIFSINLTKTVEKNEMVNGVVDSLRSLIQSEDLLQINVNTNLGFFIDIKCLLDKKCSPLLISSGNESRSDVNRVALLVYDYHDMCRNEIEPTGSNTFACKLLEAQGYKIIKIPYTEFKITDKLVHRVQYLENKLKELVK